VRLDEKAGNVAYVRGRVAKHEHRMMKADARQNDLPLDKYLTMCWRNFRSLGVPLRFIPPFPVDPYDPSKKG